MIKNVFFTKFMTNLKRPNYVFRPIAVRRFKFFFVIILLLPSIIVLIESREDKKSILKKVIDSAPVRAILSYYGRRS